MTKPICRACQAGVEDAFLCEGCTGQLERTLAELPSAIHDLEVTVTRQSKIGDAPQNRPVVEEFGPPGKKLPAFLRSLQGEIKLPETDVMFAAAAAELYALAVNAVGTWVRHLLEARGMTLPYDGPEGPWHQVCRHGSCEEIRRELTWTVNRLCIWLLRNVDTIRMDEAAGEIHRKVHALRKQIDVMVDRQDPQLYAGPCDAKDVRIEHQLMSGPLCAPFECGHSTCDLIRRRAVRISTWISSCGADLYGRFGDEKVTCQTCGLVYDPAERKKHLLGQIQDVLAPTVSLANGLTSLQEPVTPSMIRQMAYRNEIAQKGTDPSDGRSGMYRVGDVLEVLQKRAERKAERDCRRMSEPVRKVVS